MRWRDPSFFIGKYIVTDPLVKSVFADGRIMWRPWPFVGIEPSDGGFLSINTTTSHYLRVAMEEIVGCRGAFDQAPPNYFRPVVLELSSQICWDSTKLWRQPLARRWHSPIAA